MNSHPGEAIAIGENVVVVVIIIADGVAVRLRLAPVAIGNIPVGIITIRHIPIHGVARRVEDDRGPFPSSGQAEGEQDH